MGSTRTPTTRSFLGPFKSRFSRMSFVTALAMLKYRPATAYVRDIAHSNTETNSAREAAIESLGYLGSEADAERFFILVGDETVGFSLRKSCLLALVRIGIPEVMDAITGYLLDTESEMYGAALAALGELGSFRAQKRAQRVLGPKKGHG